MTFKNCFICIAFTTEKKRFLKLTFVTRKPGHS